MGQKPCKGADLRALIVADIHSNLEALSAVIEGAETNGGFDQIWLLGDLVGYGPDPIACIDLVRQYDTRAVAGNHDLAAAGKIKPEGFNPHALVAVNWTSLQLTPDHLAYLLDLPIKMEQDGFTMVHGSPRDPTNEYLITPESATANFPLFETPICLVGHSHIPFICQPQGDTAVFEKFPNDGTPVVLDKGPMIINPGGLGQPRDRDPRSPYALYDSRDRTLSHHRAEYDIPSTQKKMEEKGWDRYLRERIAYGL